MLEHGVVRTEQIGVRVVVCHPPAETQRVYRAPGKANLPRGGDSDPRVAQEKGGRSSLSTGMYTRSIESSEFNGPPLAGAKAVPLCKTGEATPPKTEQG